MQKLLMYDCEIINMIDDGRTARLPNYQYCDGWRDFNHMGISVIGTWRNFDVITVFGKTITVPLPLGKYEAFVNDDTDFELNDMECFAKFFSLYWESDKLIGFNSIAFDDRLINANLSAKSLIQTTFDLLCEVREAVGMPREYVYGKTRGGYNLNNLAVKNGLGSKTGTGELAPKLWQDGKQQQVIDYCLNDVKLLKQLYFKFQNGLMKDPHTLQLI